MDASCRIRLRSSGNNSNCLPEARGTRESSCHLVKTWSSNWIKIRCLSPMYERILPEIHKNTDWRRKLDGAWASMDESGDQKEGNLRSWCYACSWSSDLALQSSTTSEEVHRAQEKGRRVSWTDKARSWWEERNSSKNEKTLWEFHEDSRGVEDPKRRELKHYCKERSH